MRFNLLTKSLKYNKFAQVGFESKVVAVSLNAY